LVFFSKAEADMRREELEKKKNNKVEFVSGGTQSGTVAPTPKVNMPIPGL
jgi:ABC-type tungstate transport system permease subunit